MSYLILQYDRAVPHDGLGPGGPALRGGSGAALLPVPVQVSGPPGAGSKATVTCGHLGVFWSALETDFQQQGFFLILENCLLLSRCNPRKF